MEVNEDENAHDAEVKENENAPHQEEQVVKKSTLNVDSSPVPGAVHDNIVEDVISSSQFNPSVAENNVAYSACSAENEVADVNENANTTDASEGGDETTKEGEPANLADVAINEESPIDNVDDNKTLQIDSTDTAAEMIPQVKFASHMPH